VETTATSSLDIFSSMIWAHHPRLNDCHPST